MIRLALWFLAGLIEAVFPRRHREDVAETHNDMRRELLASCGFPNCAACVEARRMLGMEGKEHG